MSAIRLPISIRWVFPILALAAIIAISLASAGRAQAVHGPPIHAHGAGIAKVCDSPQKVGHNVNCDIILSYNDDFLDTIDVVAAFDHVDPAGGNTRVPVAGNLPITGIFGNTSCVVGPFVACTIGPDNGGGAGQVVFTSNTYVIQVGDPDPLPDQGTVQVQDQCDQGAAGCSTILNSVQFTSATQLFDPSVTVVKTGDTVSKVGDEVIYTFVITDTSTSSGVTPALILDSVIDDVLGDLTADAQANGCDPLPLQGSCNFNVAYTVQAGDDNGTDPLVNIVGVTYHPSGFNNVISDTDQHSVDLVHPSFTVDKSCDPNSVQLGQTLTWTVTIDNTGDVPLDYNVVDVNNIPVATPNINGAIFNHGPNDAPIVLTDTHVVTLNDPDPISNTVTVTATLLNGLDNVLTASASDDCDPFGVPNTVLTLDTSAANIEDGDSVTLTITDTNTGQVPLTNNSITVDSSPTVNLDGVPAPQTYTEASVPQFVGGDTGNDGIMDPGETWTWTVVAGPITAATTFTAIGSGVAPSGQVVTFPDFPTERDIAAVRIPRGVGGVTEFFGGSGSSGTSYGLWAAYAAVAASIVAVSVLYARRRSQA
jgi:uncharacterized repeat protein (TIGR01451 family)